MKRRTFYLTLLLFLLTVHSGILLIAVNTYRNTVEQARGHAAAEHYFIASGLLRDLAALDGRGVDYRQDILGLMRPYDQLAESQSAALSLYDSETLVYSSRDGDTTAYDAATTNGELRSVTLIGDEVLVTGGLPVPYQTYVLFYRSDISAALEEWRRMTNTMFGVGLALSGLLAAFLALLLGKLFRPLREIAASSRRIAEGEYTTRIAVTGKDELAGMAGSFNHMADEIERQMAELTASAEQKQNFIDNFAHELKTPLTAIYGYAEQMQKTVLSEDDRQFALDCILSQSKRMQTLAYQMMELAGLRSGEIRMERVDLDALFQTVRQAMSPKATEKNVDLLFSADIAELRGDLVLLESLLTNLLDNAVKASNPGEPVLVRVFEENGMSVLEVEDRGKGIPMEAVAQLTQPFYRVERHRHRRDGGAGLGLAICQLIVEKHGATLSFRSEPGKGTTARITFTTLQ